MRLTVKIIPCLRKAALICITFYYTVAVYAQPINSIFSYQGRLDIAGEPANGFFDFRAILRDSLDSGTQVGEDININSAEVIEGIVNLTLDFGVDAFNGEQRFLELLVRDPSSGAFILLEPRQAILPTPYSLSTSKIDGDVFRRGTIGDCSVPLGVPASGSFTFPIAFPSPPMIFLTTNRSPNPNGCLTAGLQGSDEFGFSWIAFTDGGARPCNCIHWLAIGRP